MIQTLTLRATIHRIPAWALALLASAAAAGASQEPAGANRYVVVGPEGAVLRNLPDDKGLAVARVREDTPLLVRERKLEWLRAEPPGGLEVWVFGKYLAASGREGWLELTGNGVWMRPLPSSGRESFPLPTKLYRGDRVRMIRRHDPSKPLAEDWVKIVTPPGVSAWVRADRTRPLPAGVDGDALWAQASAAARPSEPAASTGAAPVEASVQEGSPAAQARELVDEAASRLAELPKDGTADYQPVVELLDQAIALDPGGTTAELARTQLEEIALRKRLDAMRRRLREEQERRQAEEQRWREELERITVEKDPLWGRFTMRGWLEREKRIGEPVRYVLRWGGERVAEVICESGRYDLDLFSGFELGLTGATLRRASEAQGSQPALPVIDVRRIEVLSGRYEG